MPQKRSYPRAILVYLNIKQIMTADDCTYLTIPGCLLFFAWQKLNCRSLRPLDAGLEMSRVKLRFWSTNLGWNLASTQNICILAHAQVVIWWCRLAAWIPRSTWASRTADMKCGGRRLDWFADFHIPFITSYGCMICQWTWHMDMTTIPGAQNKRCIEFTLAACSCSANLSPLPWCWNGETWTQSLKAGYLRPISGRAILAGNADLSVDCYTVHCHFTELCHDWTF